ncbi:hypothetical protein EDC14_1009143 [Hydrogenispora ethanolica]|uniref:Uncharacterized protein n=1 Tax=Hydrogenispora ethanolica TaxID=1082276 RepID=A0A4R1RVY1_HYDET|nr:hypothetical protein EDC14_1009143 [Hydrogenispora ethanolica]
MIAPLRSMRAPLLCKLTQWPCILTLLLCMVARLPSMLAQLLCKLTR